MAPRWCSRVGRRARCAATRSIRPATSAPPRTATAPPSCDVSDAAALELLTEGELEVLGRIPWASNATLLARVCRREETSLAIYKPRRGEQPLWDFPEGTLYRREVAAYVVSEALGWGLVPPTIVRGGPFGVGSVQLHVEADAQLTAFELVEHGNQAMPLVAAFDVVINNADRKGGHCLAETAAMVRDGALRRELRGLLEPDEIAALGDRASTLAHAGCLPLPSGRRPYPWPLV